MTDNKKMKWANIIGLAFGIAILPPLWAILSPYIGISTGAVALICAGVYVASGNKRRDAPKVISGFILGDIWAYLVVLITGLLPWNADVKLYATLFVLGFAAVLIAENLPKFIYLPSWLCGWAVGLAFMGHLNASNVGTIPFEIAIAMVVGVIYVGIGVDAFQRLIVKIIMKNENKTTKIAE